VVDSNDVTIQGGKYFEEKEKVERHLHAYETRIVDGTNVSPLYWGY